MKIYTVFPGTRTCREVKRLYLSAFPAEERYPFGRLWLLSALKSRVALRAYGDGDAFCGFTLTVDSGKYLYISFIAVAPEVRSRGYGAQMLELLRQGYPERALLVEVEAPEETSPNCGQRVRRIDFYRKNGFHDLDRTITGRGVTYALLSTDTDFDREAYWKIFDQLSLGLGPWLRRLKKRLGR